MNKTIIFGLIGAVIIIALLIFTTYQANQSKLHSTPMAPVEKLVSALFFNQGTYTDYKSLFANQNHVISESEFNNYQFKGKPDMTFTVGNDSLANVMKNMKQKQIDSKTVVVFWSVDPKETAETARVKWTVIKQNGKWYIEN